MNFLAENYDIWRAGHILSVIGWMAGLLYLPRLFIYHFKAKSGGELETSLIVQEQKLLRMIMNPAFVLTWVFGILLIFSNAGRAGGWSIFLAWPWILKFTLITLMTLLHHYFAIARKHFAAGKRPLSEKKWRFINEAPAVLAILIVIIAVVWIR
ncbi:MAG: TIGR00701 family protein [Robiginitomaculum sp.]|nr:MAG: TIGR00701 family protein [Robiginitomaculum sp.]